MVVTQPIVTLPLPILNSLVVDADNDVITVASILLMTVKLRVSDNPFNATFPEEYKEKVLEYLNENSILDGTATKAGIDFQVEKVVADGVTLAYWSDAMLQLYYAMKSI